MVVFALHQLIVGIVGRMWMDGSSRFACPAEWLTLPFGSGSSGLGSAAQCRPAVAAFLS
jgi:hypothetical protein